MTNRSFLVVALVALAACGRGGADAGETQPAGTQPAPTAQHQASPQTEPNTPQSSDSQSSASAVRKPKTYQECLATPGAPSEAERLRACMSMPDAPK